MFERVAAKYPEGLACKGMGVDWGQMFREPLTGNRLGGGCACRAGLRGGGGGWAPPPEGLMLLLSPCTTQMPCRPHCPMMSEMRKTAASGFQTCTAVHALKRSKACCIAYLSQTACAVSTSRWFKGSQKLQV